MGAKYFSINSGKGSASDEEQGGLIPPGEEYKPEGNTGTIFTILTLIILVIVLAAALFFVTAWNFERHPDPWEVKEGDLVIPIFTDVHLYTDIEDCKNYKPTESGNTDL